MNNGVSFFEWCQKNNREDLLEMWDAEKNFPFTPETVFYSSNKIYYWKCKNGHEWSSSLSNHLRRKGCSFCSGRYLVKGENDFESWCCNNQHDRVLKEWDSEKNEKLPSEVTIKSKYQAWWICSNCGREWKAEVRNRVKFPNGGCSKCSRPTATQNAYKTRLAQKGSLAEYYPEIIKEWDYSKNKDLSPESILPNSNKIVWWICKKGHSYKSCVNHKTSRNSGCPICSNKKVLKGYNDLLTTNPEIAKEWDYSKNILSPESITAGSNKKVWWICSNCGFNWEATVVDRQQERGCPQCNKENKSSFPEQAIYFYIKSVFGDAVIGDRHLLKELDIFIPSKRVAIEYDGGNWHKDIQRDLEKNSICKAEGIILYRVRENTCPPMEEEEGIHVLHLQYGNNQQLEETIKRICEDLSGSTVDVNIERDKMDIYSQYLLKKKGKSVENLFPEVMAFWDYEKNGSLKPSSISFGSHKKVYWICDKGHSYQQTVKDKVIGRGCPICSNHTLKASVNDFETWCITNKKENLLEEWDCQKNKKKPSEIMMGSEVYVWWICPNGHSYKSIPYNRKKGVGCPYCSVPAKKLLVGFNDLKTKYPEIASEWDYEKNGDLRPDGVLSGSGKKVWWKCKKGHSYYSQIATRVSGYGCPICAKAIASKTVINIDTGEVFRSITEAAQKCKTSPSSIGLVCNGKTKTAGGFHWKYVNVTPKISLVSWCKDNNREYILNEWNYEKNNNLLPEMFTYGSHKKINWKCSKGHEWEAPIKARTKNRGNMCPICRMFNGKTEG